MFVHKSKSLALSFAAAIIGLAAGPAQADRQRGDYCSAPDVCSQRQIGIIQKERDGVNYFYGGSDVAPPQIAYIYLRSDDIGQSSVEPIQASDLYTTNYALPLSDHRFKMKKNNWKWLKNHPRELDIPGLQWSGKYKGP